MKLTSILCLALGLSGGLAGCCSPAAERAVATSDQTGAAVYIAGIHMIDARGGWAWSSGVEGSNLLLHTSNGGRTWRDRTPRGFSYSTDGSCFLDSQTAWVSTQDRNTYAGGLLRTTDGGKSWSVLIQDGAAPYGYLTEMASCCFFNARDGMARSADGSAGSTHVCYYETHDGGKNWTAVDIIPPGGRYSNEPRGTIGLSDITPETMGYCPPANVVITHGDMDDEKPKDAVRLTLSANLGKTWRDLNLPLPSEKYREGLVECGTPVFLDGKHSWLPARIAKENADNTLNPFAWTALAFYATADGGETWTPRPGVVDGGTNNIGDERGFADFVSENDIFVRCGANLLVTDDGARSWHVIHPNIDLGTAGGERDVAQMDFVDAAHGWIIISDNTRFSPDGNCSLYRSRDGGKTWTELPLKIRP